MFFCTTGWGVYPSSQYFCVDMNYHWYCHIYKLTVLQNLNNSKCSGVYPSNRWLKTVFEKPLNFITLLLDNFLLYFAVEHFVFERQWWMFLTKRTVHLVFKIVTQVPYLTFFFYQGSASFLIHYLNIWFTYLYKHHN